MKFSTGLLQMGNNTGIEVPHEVVVGAKKAQTRSRRIAKTVDGLKG